MFPFPTPSPIESPSFPKKRLAQINPKKTPDYESSISHPPRLSAQFALSSSVAMKRGGGDESSRLCIVCASSPDSSAVEIMSGGISLLSSLLFSAREATTWAISPPWSVVVMIRGGMSVGIEEMVVVGEGDEEVVAMTFFGEFLEDGGGGAILVWGTGTGEARRVVGASATRQSTSLKESIAVFWGGGGGAVGRVGWSRRVAEMDECGKACGY